MIPAGTKVYFAKAPADFRRSFDGLAATAMSALSKDPREGGLFVFLNRRGNQARILFKDDHGWCLLAKRLDKGQFRRVQVEEGSVCWETEPAALLRFLDQIELTPVRLRRRPTRAAHLEVVQP